MGSPFALDDEVIQQFQAEVPANSHNSDSNPFGVDGGNISTRPVASTPIDPFASVPQNETIVTLNPFGSGVITGANAETPTNWVTFEGGKDSFNPFDAMENDEKKQLRLNLYKDDEANKYRHQFKKVEQEFISKVSNEQK